MTATARAREFYVKAAALRHKELSGRPSKDKPRDNCPQVTDRARDAAAGRWRNWSGRFPNKPKVDLEGHVQINYLNIAGPPRPARKSGKPLA